MLRISTQGPLEVPIYGRKLEIQYPPNAPSEPVLRAVHEFDRRLADGENVHRVYAQVVDERFHEQPAARADVLVRSNSKAALSLLDVDRDADKYSGAIVGHHPNAPVDELLLQKLAKHISKFQNPLDRAAAFRRFVHMKCVRAATLTVLAHEFRAIPREHQEVELHYLLARVAQLPETERTPELILALEEATQLTAEKVAGKLEVAPEQHRLPLFRALLAHAPLDLKAEAAMEKAIREVYEATKSVMPESQFARQHELARRNFRAQRPIATAEHADFAKNIILLSRHDRYPAFLDLLARTGMNLKAYTALAHCLEHLPAGQRLSAKNAIDASIAKHFQITPGEPFFHKQYVAQRELGCATPKFGSAKMTQVLSGEHMRALREESGDSIADDEVLKPQVNVRVQDYEYLRHLEPIWRSTLQRANLGLDDLAELKAYREANGLSERKQSPSPKELAAKLRDEHEAALKARSGRPPLLRGIRSAGDLRLQNFAAKLARASTSALSGHRNSSNGSLNSVNEDGDSYRERTFSV